MMAAPAREKRILLWHTDKPEWVKETVKDGLPADTTLDEQQSVLQACIQLEQDWLLSGSFAALVRGAEPGNKLHTVSDFYMKHDQKKEKIKRKKTIIFGAGPSGLTLACAVGDYTAMVLEKRTSRAYRSRQYILFLHNRVVEQMETFPALRDVRRCMKPAPKPPFEPPPGTIIPVGGDGDGGAPAGHVVRLGDLQKELSSRATKRGIAIHFDTVFDMNKVRQQLKDAAVRVVDATGGQGRYNKVSGTYGATVTLNSRIAPVEMQTLLLPKTRNEPTRYFCVQIDDTDRYTYYFGLKIRVEQYQAFRRHKDYIPLLVFQSKEYFERLADGRMEEVKQGVHIVSVTPDQTRKADNGVIRIGDARRSADFFTAQGATRGILDALEEARERVE